MQGARAAPAMSRTRRAQSEPERSGNAHRDIVGAGRVPIVSVAVCAVTLVVDAVSGTEPVFGPVENEGQRSRFDGEILARAFAVRWKRARIDARRERDAHQFE